MGDWHIWRMETQAEAAGKITTKNAIVVETTPRVRAGRIWEIHPLMKIEAAP